MNGLRRIITRRSARAFSSGTLETNFSRKFGEGGTIGAGRKQFEKGWAFMRPRKPINVQERWHRAPVQRIVNYDAFEQVGTKQEGERDTLEWRMHYRTTALDDDAEASEEVEDLSKLSPWHDIPLVYKNTESGQFLFNYVNEIPKGERAKMECATKEKFNPIKQDVKKGKLRYFTYGDLPFNYGFIPQTWEDPDRKSAFTDCDTMGDGDPVDVVEISSEPIGMGEVVPLKVLGTLGLVDEGETDWKVVAINANNPIASKMNSIKDVDQAVLDNIYDWFKMYKTTDGKPINEFSHGGAFQDVAFTMNVINECHHHWKDLMLHRVESKLELDSVTYRFMVAQGITSTQLPPTLPGFGISHEEQYERFPTKADLPKGAA